jgi:RimJ/RimL family protein N-acetyltransferase
MALPFTLTRIVGERVTLDPLRPEDADDLFALQSDPEVCRYLLYDARTREQVDEILARDATKVRLADVGDYLQPAIRDEHGRFLGTMYLHLTSVDDRTAEIGWILLPSSQGRGYARDAGVARGQLGTPVRH